MFMVKDFEKWKNLVLEVFAKDWLEVLLYEAKSQFGGEITKGRAIPCFIKKGAIQYLRKQIEVGRWSVKCLLS